MVRSQKLGPVSANTLVTFDKILTNVGNSFDAVTSHFVSPISATYVIMAHVMGVDEREAHAFIMVNDRHQVTSRVVINKTNERVKPIPNRTYRLQIPVHATTHFGSGSQSLVLTLQRGDHIWIELGTGSALMNDYTTFSGFVLFSSDVIAQQRRVRTQKRVDEDDYNALKSNYLNDWHTW